MPMKKLVGGNADRRTIGEDVGVQIDQAARDDLARRRQHPLRLVGSDLLLQGFDDPEADTDVALEEIEFVVGAHRRPGSRRTCGGRSRGGC